MGGWAEPIAVTWQLEDSNIPPKSSIDFPSQHWAAAFNILVSRFQTIDFRVWKLTCIDGNQGIVDGCWWCACRWLLKVPQSHSECWKCAKEAQKTGPVHVYGSSKRAKRHKSKKKIRIERGGKRGRLRKREREREKLGGNRKRERRSGGIVETNPKMFL